MDVCWSNGSECILLPLSDMAESEAPQRGSIILAVRPPTRTELSFFGRRGDGGLHYGDGRRSSLPHGLFMTDRLPALITGLEAVGGA